MATTRTLRATGHGAISTTLAPGVPWQLEEIRVHLSLAGGANNLTATVDHGAGAAYDIVILTQDMTTIADLSWQPTRPKEFGAGDELDIAWTNTNGRTYGLEIVYKAI
jgi:hypothetical protein